MNRNFTHLIVGILVFISLNSAAAGSILILPKLASVDKISLEIPHGYSYQEISSLEPTSFNNLIRNLVEADLRRCDLEIDEKSAVAVFIIVEGARDQGDNVAFAVRVELIEPAVLERKWPQQGVRGPTTTVTTWRDSDIFLAEQEDAEWRLLEAIVSLFERFVEGVDSARQTYPEESFPKECEEVPEHEDAPLFPDYEKILADWKLKTKSGPASPQ